MEAVDGDERTVAFPLREAKAQAGDAAGRRGCARASLRRLQERVVPALSRC